MNLLKTSLLTLVSTIIKVITGVIINKAASVLIGPMGIAMIGQFQSFAQIVMTFSQGGINTGVVKYTAEYENYHKRNLLWGTSLKITICCSLICSIVLIIFSDYFSVLILKEQRYYYIFVFFGISVFLFTLNQLLLSILNGTKNIFIFVTTNISQSIYGLIISLILIYYYKIDGALLAIVFNQSLVFFTLVVRIRKKIFYRLADILKEFNFHEAKKLLSFSFMSLTTAILYPSSLLVIRNFIGDHISWDAAGYWQSMWYISTMYLMVFTTALSIYFVPKLSELKSKNKIRNELRSTALLILPTFVFIAMMIFLLKDFIVVILFSNKFYAMTDLFKWQLIGDFFKVASLLLNYVLVAKAKIKEFIISEIVLYLLLVIFSIILVEIFGVVGATYAYALTYILYLGLMIFYNKKIF